MKDNLSKVEKEIEEKQSASKSVSDAKADLDKKIALIMTQMGQEGQDIEKDEKELENLEKLNAELVTKSNQGNA